MGTVSADEIRTDEIKSEPGSGFITIGSAVFPVSDAAPRSVASFGSAESEPFVTKAVYQLVVSSAATINAGTTIVGVNFDGPVVLDLPTSSTTNGISVVDEGGLCSASNTITATSPGALGDLVLSTPYSHLSIKATSTSALISEVRECPVVV
jgi:hypothetical protein